MCVSLICLKIIIYRVKTSDTGKQEIGKPISVIPLSTFCIILWHPVKIKAISWLGISCSNRIQNIVCITLERRLRRARTSRRAKNRKKIRMVKNYLDRQLYRARFLNYFSTIYILGEIILCYGRLSSALSDV